MLFNAIREVQLPLIAALLLAGCGAKLARALRVGSADAALGPTALFPMRMRRPLAIVMCAIELGLGVGLILTAGPIRSMAAADSIRLVTGVMFLVATSALIELRSARPDVGCGCFGDFSTAPVSGRTLARSAFLAVAALSTISLPAMNKSMLNTNKVGVLATLAAELIILGALSPELGEGLIRLGYSAPCELRATSAERTLAALRRSKQWRRRVGMITDPAPIDMWRELCWRYAVFPASVEDRRTEVVFAIFLAQRHPTVHAALVDAGTGQPLPWPAPPPRTGLLRRRPAPPTPAPSVPVHVGSAPADMPLSSDL